jgi:hypothetical protein
MSGVSANKRFGVIGFQTPFFGFYSLETCKVCLSPLLFSNEEFASCHQWSTMNTPPTMIKPATVCCDGQHIHPSLDTTHTNLLPHSTCCFVLHQCRNYLWSCITASMPQIVPQNSVDCEPTPCLYFIRLSESFPIVLFGLPKSGFKQTQIT